MLTIVPCGRATVARMFGPAGAAAGRLIESLADDGELPPEAEQPFVQLAHSDVSDADVELAFGYAGIWRANAPIGLPIRCEPHLLTQSVMIFPLEGLESHLRSSFDEIVSKAERVGFAAFLEEEEIGALEYLVVGTIESIRWCNARRAALMFRW